MLILRSVLDLSVFWCLFGSGSQDRVPLDLRTGYPLAVLSASTPHLATLNGFTSALWVYNPIPSRIPCPVTSIAWNRCHFGGVMTFHPKSTYLSSLSVLASSPLGTRRNITAVEPEPPSSQLGTRVGLGGQSGWPGPWAARSRGSLPPTAAPVCLQAVSQSNIRGGLHSTQARVPCPEIHCYPVLRFRFCEDLRTDLS